MGIQYKIVKLVSRTGKDMEFQFDGIVHKVSAEKGLLVPEDCALHGIRRSLVKFDPITGVSVFGLGIEGQPNSEPLTQEDLSPRMEAIEREGGLPAVSKLPLKGAVIGNERASGGSQSIIAKPTE